MKTAKIAGAAALAAAVIVPLAGTAAAVPAGHPYVAEIYYNSPGKDTRSNASRNAEWVKIVNPTAHAVSLTGWTVKDRQNHTYRFGTFTLKAHGTVVLHTGTGRNTTTSRYWGSGNYIWNNDTDAATLRNSRNAVVDSLAYKNSHVAYVKHR
ncbi:lamin tail domain-containing protein [Streptacidiphilus sp. N1-12]|uniref:Lamin tail domain-containing protein n=2 Tax=Streptacidiphilus alkalitolerans TaxID=3342712 RepID=A0ABV6VLA1_9ACTN